MTRIQLRRSAHERGICVLFLGLCCAMPALAQPQAPIEWGEVEVLYSDSAWWPMDITAFGDTIVLHSIQHNPPFDQPALCISGDNGLTWSPWQVFTEDWSNHLTSPVAFTSVGTYCITAHNGHSRWTGLSFSDDLGWTWQPPCFTLPQFQALTDLLMAHGDTLFARHRGYNVISTSDGGCTFSDTMSTGLPYGIESTAVGGGWIHVVTRHWENAYDWPLTYTRAPLSTGVFEEPRSLHEGITWTRSAHVECDDEGTVMILSSVNWAPPGHWLSAQVVDISHDYGATWTARDTLTPLESAAFADETITRWGTCWLAVWWDSTVSDGFTADGLWCKFSANRGRTWYPSHQVEDDPVFAGGIDDSEIRESEINVYGTFEEFNGETANIFVRWRGQLQVDSIAPIVPDALELPLLVPPDTLLSLSLSASDNDSLWLTQFVARQMYNEADSLVISLIPDSLGNHVGEWLVPADTAAWLCYYRAEDMWENVSYVPMEGPADPWILYVGAITKTRDINPLPSSFTVSNYPNPSNNWPIHTHSPGWIQHRPATAAIYNVLGQKLIESNVLSQSVGLGGTLDAATGIYFVRITSGDHSALLKFLILK